MAASGTQPDLAERSPGRDRRHAAGPDELLSAAGWWLLAAASAWFTIGLAVLTTDVGDGRRLAVSRWVAVHFVPLLTGTLAPPVGADRTVHPRPDRGRERTKVACPRLDPVGP